MKKVLALQLLMTLINKGLAAFIGKYNILYLLGFFLSLGKQGSAGTLTSIWKCYILIDKILFFLLLYLMESTKKVILFRSTAIKVGVQ